MDLLCLCLDLVEWIYVWTCGSLHPPHRSLSSSIFKYTTKELVMSFQCLLYTNIFFPGKGLNDHLNLFQKNVERFWVLLIKKKKRMRTRTWCALLFISYLADAVESHPTVCCFCFVFWISEGQIYFLSVPVQHRNTKGFSPLKIEHGLKRWVVDKLKTFPFKWHSTACSGMFIGALVKCILKKKRRAKYCQLRMTG